MVYAYGYFVVCLDEEGNEGKEMNEIEISGACLVIENIPFSWFVLRNKW
jgi:hypothetical protein